MVLLKRRIVVCFVSFTLLTHWTALEPIESHVLRFNSTDAKEAVLHSNRLHNPCSPGRHPPPEPRKAYLALEDDITYTQLTGLTGTPGNKLGLVLLRELITKSTFLQGLATNVIRMKLIEECTELHLPNVANIPNPDQLKSKKLFESIEWLYSSLTNQTAHTFFIWQKQLNYMRHNCTVHTAQDVPLSLHNPRNHSKVLAQHYWTIAINLRDLMCIFNQVLNAFNIDLKTVELTDRVLAHTVTDSPICSRKAVLDCQILKSSIVLLENMSDFLRDQTIQLVTSMNTKTYF